MTGQGFILSSYQGIQILDTASEMSMKSRIVFFSAVVLLAVAAAAVFFVRSKSTPADVSGSSPHEAVVQILPLAGPIADRSSELSGLAWNKDWLYLLPQYPERFGDGDGVLFRLAKDQLREALANGAAAALTPQVVPFHAPGLKEQIPNFQGYEAIGFHDDRIYLTIEAGEGLDMHGYIVSGVAGDDAVTINPDSLFELALPIASENHSDEALVVTDEQVLAFYEINGAELNPHPAAQVFDLDLHPLAAIPFPALEYRVTDAAWSGEEIWVINYYFPGGEIPEPDTDPLVETFGKGSTHSQFKHVERIVGLHYTQGGITLGGQAPLQLELIEDARNWEGLALMDDSGFLMVTDKYPGTMLGFVKLP